MSSVTQAKRIVVKVGTSTLTYENGKLNLRRIERLCKVLSDLQNSGREMVLVTSGAIGVGVGKLGLRERPRETEKRQAVAAVGQCELMFIYDKFFGEYNRTVAQVLLTGDVIASENTRKNTENTFQELIGMDIIPVVNENDTVVVDELVGNQIGDNDTLSAIVARLIGADLLILLTDIDGLYDDNPSVNPNASRIPVVPQVTDEIRALAGGAGSRRGTGGMRTKVDAADFVNQAGIPCCIMSGAYPEKLYDLFEGAQIGTVFGRKNG
ncbi:Glutamate 5-kinase 1 [Caprobacter fermentans]|uniref:Glutamate 5-kinase n=1 Tax=Caproicibacter fermentans TaxID=2576756 RepID=A0A6N8I233_9FIRM|nr:glutamate 5-kinase [Caproicibacter fermentans]MVB12134.1 Glutamate 5-kinase 1 [Caproicibacter fermentans]OCN01214.1 glutamate 5-kinase [Clostridium sp. W14A]QNK42619.1 glutamate 5-kinase [Caproicibacter fermentans]